MQSLKNALITMGLIVLLGTLSVACSALPAFLGGYANQLESIVGVTVAGTYTITITKDNKTLITETWNCSTDGTKLTGCHRVSSRTVSTDVIAPAK